MIENPFAAGGPIGLTEGGVEIGVDVEADGVGGPFDGVEVKVIGEILACGKSKDRGQVAGVCGGAGAVQRTVDFVGLLADVFHDVDFAALGPADGGNVFSEHPERGPNSLPFRDFDAGLEAAVGLDEQALCLEAGGGVLAGYPVGAGVGFFLRGDDEISFFDSHVFLAIRVGLEFVVAPAFAAEVVGPFGGIGRGAVRSGEFVAPDKAPAGMKLRLRVSVNKTSGEQKN
jgi:hypothetical protein